MPAACKAKFNVQLINRARLELPGLIITMIMMTMLIISMTMIGAGSASQGMLGATRLARPLLGTAPSALDLDRQETTSKG